MTSPKRIDFEQTKDRQINDLQRKINDATSIVRNSPMGDGRLITGIQFPYNSQSAPSYVHNVSPGVVLIDHGLGRALQGWFVCRLQAPYPNGSNFDDSTYPMEPYDPSGTVGFHVDPAKQLCLISNNPYLTFVVPCTISIWVF